MPAKEDRIILMVSVLLLLVILIASLTDLFRPLRSRLGQQLLSGGYGMSDPNRLELPVDWEERHTFYHLRGIPHSHPNDKEETARAEAAWAEELQRRQAAQKNQQVR
jgi:hypothetical protein